MAAKRSPLSCDSDDDMLLKRIKREDTSEQSVQQWSLNPDDVPFGTKKIYVMIRGRSPGFYFDWSAAEPQCRGFSSALFESFPKGKKKLDPNNLEQVVRDAVAYMNHDTRNCKYSCYNSSNCVQPPEVAKAAQYNVHNADAEHQAQAVDAPVLQTTRDRRSCRACGKLTSRGRLKICPDCPALDLYLVKVRSCAEKFDLCDEQTKLLEAIAVGDNIFFTGAAGTGKSRVLEALADFFSNINVAAKIVAPTGIAALNVGGITIHVYAGWSVKLAQASKDELRKVAGEKKVFARFKSTDVLIIDEISMVESDTLSRLSCMMQEALKAGLPFGGVQVVITGEFSASLQHLLTSTSLTIPREGDFFQLPPVLPFQTCIEFGKDLERSTGKSGTGTCPSHGEFHDKDKWPFKSDLWRECNFKNFQLVRVHRQQDAQYTEILHSIRKGVEWTLKQENVLFNHSHNVIFDDAVKLNPLRKEVDAIDDSHMEQLETPIHR